MPPRQTESQPRASAEMNDTRTNHTTTKPSSEQHPSVQTHGLGRLAICAIGISVCYLYYGHLQETLFTGEHHLGATFLLVTQCITNTAVAYLWHLTHENNKSSNQHKAHVRHSLLIFTAALYVAAMACSNEAIQYVSYPVAVLAKSCKLVPIMIVGQLVERKLYSPHQWFAVFCITTGIGMFQWSRMSNTANDSTKDQESMYGMLLLLASLTADGGLSACQNILKQPLEKFRPPSAVETMYYVNLYALIFLVPLAVYSLQWRDGIKLLHQHPGLVWKVFVLNMTVAMGQVFIFLTLTWYSSLLTTIITTTRKFITILWSCRHFGHVFTMTQWSAVGLVFCGLYVSIMEQRPRKMKVE